MDNSDILNVEIVTPQKVLFQGEAESVIVPGSKSSFQILRDHAPIVSSLDLGITNLRNTEGKEFYFATSKGFVEVHKNKISILVESADEASEIDISKEEELLAEAKEKLNNAEDKKDQVQIKELIAIIQNKIKTAEKA